MTIFLFNHRLKSTWSRDFFIFNYLHAANLNQISIDLNRLGTTTGTWYGTRARLGTGTGMVLVPVTCMVSIPGK